MKANRVMPPVTLIGKIRMYHHTADMGGNEMLAQARQDLALDILVRFVESRVRLRRMCALHRQGRS